MELLTYRKCTSSALLDNSKRIPKVVVPICAPIVRVEGVELLFIHSRNVHWACIAVNKNTKSSPLTEFIF